MGEAGTRWDVTGHRWFSGHLPLAPFVQILANKPWGMGLAFSHSLRHSWGPWGKENSGMASLSLAKARAFFLYLSPNAISKSQTAGFLDFPFPA